MSAEAHCWEGGPASSAPLSEAGPLGKELVLIFFFFFVVLKDYAIKIISLVLLIESNYYLTHNGMVAVV